MLYELRDRVAAYFTGKPKTRSGLGAYSWMNGSNGGFEGARRDRMTEDWNPGNAGPNSLHRNGAAFLRERARDLVLNNPLAESAVGAYRHNVVGNGIWPKADFGAATGQLETRDVFLRELERWGWREADCTRRQTFYELQDLALEEVIVGGGVLVNYLELPKGPKQRLGLALELIPEERFCEELDYVPGTNRKTANRIERGIEIDALGRDVAYWVYAAHPNDLDVMSPPDPIRLSVENCEYIFVRRRVGQRRGYSWLNPIVQTLFQLGYYTQNELQSSAIKSCFSLIVKTAEGNDVVGIADANGSTNCGVYDSSGNRIEKVQPGMIGYLKHGDEVEAVQPTTPGSEAAVWTQLISQSCAIGFGLSYEELCRDYSRGNFGTMRAGMNADRIRFSRIQQFLVEHFCKPTYSRFVASAVRASAPGFPSPADYVSDRDDWDRATWQCPGWRSPSPLDDAKANQLNRQMGFDTHMGIVGQSGRDSDENFRQLERELPQVEAAGIELYPKQAGKEEADGAQDAPPAKPKPKAKK